MITLYAFGAVHPAVHGETRDLRVQWALEEMGLPYRVRGVDHTAGENLGPAFSAISPFNQIPVLEHDGLVLSESAAILIHLAETSGRLTPLDPEGRAHVMQWCFAAVATVSPALSMISMFDAGFMGKDAAARDFLVMIGRRWLDGVERQLEGREWIVGDMFTIADILMATVLREIREAELMDDYPNVRTFYERALARPAWLRTRALYAERMGVDAASFG